MTMWGPAWDFRGARWTNHDRETWMEIRNVEELRWSYRISYARIHSFQGRKKKGSSYS